MQNKMKKRIISISIVAAVVLLIAVTLMHNKKISGEKNKIVDRSDIAVAVNIFNVAYSSFEGEYMVPAVLEPNCNANIAATTQGKIESLHIELGTKVQKGQVIGTIDTKLKQLNLQAAQLVLDKLGKDYQRYKDLYESNAATEISFNEVKYNYENAGLQVEQINQQIADCNFIAPITGIITTKNVEAGEYVNPGFVIANVVDVSQIKASVMVSEYAVYKIKERQTVSVTCDIFPGKTFNGQVLYVSPKGDENHNYKIEITITNDNSAQLKAGTYVSVKFNLNSKANVLQIPKNALVEGVKNPYVFVVKNSTVELRKIVIGRELKENIEVVVGLKGKEQVVVSGQINLSDGSKVTIIKNN
jgi:RND family efflux transporter MFP subunit